MNREVLIGIGIALIACALLFLIPQLMQLHGLRQIGNFTLFSERHSERAEVDEF
jgi:hypothetical protein